MADLNAFPGLPEFLDPILDHIWAVLPSPIYTACDYLLSQAYALLYSLLTLTLTLSHSIIADTTGIPFCERIRQWWDSVETTELSRPLVTLLAAYFALLFFYRTSRWIISMIFPLVKWGAILITLGTAAGWCLANANAGVAEGVNAAGRWGVARAVGEVMDELLHQRAAERPKGHEPRDRQQQRQHSEARPHDRDANYIDIQKIINEILTGDGGWWKAVFGTDGEVESRRQRRGGRSPRPM